MIYSRVDLNWYNFSKKHNFEIFTSFDFKLIESLIKKKKIHGIIFSGGGDISKIKKNKLNLIRDKFEKKIINLALKKKIKSLFVCRGMQLLSEYYKLDIMKVKNHVKKNHRIYFNDESQDHTIKCINVNSFHNYSIFNSNNKFEVLAKHKDGSIELMKKNNFLAMMFHPERKSINQLYVDRIIKGFF